MPEKTEHWLLKAALREAGNLTAAYPYSDLREILEPEHARLAILDETLPLEKEFGRFRLEPLYRLLWILNGTQGVATSHTVFAKPDYVPQLTWASAGIACQIIMISRAREEHHNVDAARDAAEELLQTLAAAGHKYSGTKRGWQISVGPIHIDYVYVTEDQRNAPSADFIEQRGYGCTLAIAGCATSRVKAAERWSSAVTFVCGTIEELLSIPGVTRAQPYRHMPGEPTPIIGRDVS